jgi:4-amino-4-deoxy-L-arabinose transferase-like glycosyltransferase
VTAPSAAADPPPRRDRFGATLAAIAVAGAVLRITYVVVLRDHNPVFTDSLGYHFRAQLLADGHWFRLPAQQMLGIGGNPPDAHVPPMWTLVLGGVTKLGLRTMFQQQLATCLVGAATIVVTGLAGAAVCSRRVGLVAAAVVAVYPNTWIYERELLSEPLSMLGVAAFLLVTYRFLASPTGKLAVTVGAMTGLVALIRSELILASVLIVLPSIALARQVDWRRRLQWLAAAGLACVVVLAPWTAFNATRFDRPVLLSTGFGAAFRAGNCEPTYEDDDLLGWFSIDYHQDEHGCSVIGPFDPDPSAADGQFRHAAFSFMSDHLSRVPVVVAARIGRTFNVFRPLDQVHREGERHSPLWVIQAGMVGFWVLVPFAVGGVVRLRRRGVAVFPLLAFFLIVVVAVGLTIGSVRYRAPAEVPLAILAAVGIDALADRRRPADARTV